MDALRSRRLIIPIICLAVFAIVLDTTIVNVALPTLVTELGASNRQLLWIVDAYNLTFAALVLAAGSLGDRFGRKGMLMIGLAVFGAGTLAGSFTDEPAQLIAARAVMGVGAAIVFPATLSILTNVFTERAERAKAIGIWGATTGLGVALGPIVGGWLLEHYWWGSVFLALAPVALVAIAAVALVVPTSRDPEAAPLDWGGLALSSAGLGALVYTIIEAPDRGWTSTGTAIGFALAAVALAAFVAWERRRIQPMLDVGLFRNLRFSAASGSVTVAFFALFGFIFLITQYFQFLRGYSPLETGLRLLPVASAVAIGSIVGTQLAVRIGTKVIVAGGLLSLGVGYLWVSTASVATSYGEIAGQMVVIGLGMGFTSAPATEAIMGVVPAAKAGVGSAVNDATREVGGTLGVAVIGSVFASLYATSLTDDPIVAGLPAEVTATAEEGVGAALLVAGELERTAGAGAGDALIAAASTAYFDGFAVGCLVAAGVALAGCVFAAVFLPARPAAAPSDEVPLAPPLDVDVDSDVDATAPEPTTVS